MKLLTYNMTPSPSAGAMDSVYNIMFRKELPHVDAKGKITDDHMPDMNRAKIKMILGNLSREHPVKWEITVCSKGHYHRYIAENGKVEKSNV